MTTKKKAVKKKKAANTNKAKKITNKNMSQKEKNFYKNLWLDFENPQISVKKIANNAIKHIKNFN